MFKLRKIAKKHKNEHKNEQKLWIFEREGKCRDATP